MINTNRIKSPLVMEKTSYLSGSIPISVRQCVSRIGNKWCGELGMTKEIYWKRACELDKRVMSDPLLHTYNKTDDYIILTYSEMCESLYPVADCSASATLTSARSPNAN
jgi:hypothetical protein